MRNGFVVGSTEVKIGNEAIEVVDKVYLGQLMQMNGDFGGEISRRIQLSWAAYSKLRDIFKDATMPMNLKRKVMNQCINPVMTYASETWALTEKLEKRIGVAQRRMERSLLGITLGDKWTTE